LTTPNPFRSLLIFSTTTNRFHCQPPFFNANRPFWPQPTLFDKRLRVFTATNPFRPLPTTSRRQFFSTASHLFHRPLPVLINTFTFSPPSTISTTNHPFSTANCPFPLLTSHFGHQPFFFHHQPPVLTSHETVYL
jgi:hypothetical protein